MKLESLEQLFVEQLQDLYSAENQLVEALPKMSQRSASGALRQAFETHHQETKAHVERLDDIFDEIGEAAKGQECKGMKGMVAEAQDLMQAADGEVRDAAMIAISQRIEHYEISGYGTARAYADLLGLPNVSRTLQITLDEEKKTDQTLNSLAARINVEAKAA